MVLSKKGVQDLLRAVLVLPSNIYNSIHTVWEDETFPFAGREIDRVTGRLSFDWTNYGVIWPANSRYQDEDSLAMIHQLKHAWKLGSNVWPHLHWYPTYDPYADNPTYPGELSVPNWTLRRRVVPNYGPAGSWETVPLIATESPNGYTWSAGDLVVSRFPEIDMSTYNVDSSLSCIIEYQILRDLSNSTGVHPGAESDWSTPVATTIKTFDSHIEKDSMGSVMQWMKR